MTFAAKLIAAGALLTLSTAAQSTIVDPPSDFLSTYTGPANADVDLLGANVGFDGTNFQLSIATSGLVGSTPGSLYAWAINRGSGIARPALAPPAGAGLLWDAVVVMFPDGTLRVVTFPTLGAPTVTSIAGGTTVSGDSLSATLSALLLPSTGASPSNYTFSLWSRVRVNPAMDGANTEVADLLAGSGNITPAVPEPATWLTMLLGFAVIGLAMRKRNTRIRVSRAH